MTETEITEIKISYPSAKLSDQQLNSLLKFITKMVSKYVSSDDMHVITNNTDLDRRKIEITIEYAIHRLDLRNEKKKTAEALKIWKKENKVDILIDILLIDRNWEFANDI